ncbi:MAG: hypothetical protein J6U22_06490 [Bacteroidaceae bacterium]|nr:hypothetical protein [Bacteroidaceae bacterium]
MTGGAGSGRLRRKKAAIEKELNSGFIPYYRLQARSARMDGIVERTGIITMRRFGQP